MDHANPQSACPLFNRIPGEVRNHIFSLTLSSYDNKLKPYHRKACYYRPHYHYAQRTDTALLRTCRRVYLETKEILASINEMPLWYFRGPPSPRGDLGINSVGRSRVEVADVRRTEMIHVFAQQFWLEDPVCLKSLLHVWWKAAPAMLQKRLKITIRHSDWWWWEYAAPLALDPKQPGRASAREFSEPPEPFAENSWGKHFEQISGLQSFELELETLEHKLSELDAIAGRASGWEFVLGDGNTLILDQAKTQRNGWVGYKLDTSIDDSFAAFNQPEEHDRPGNTFDGSFSANVARPYQHQLHAHRIPQQQQAQQMGAHYQHAQQQIAQQQLALQHLNSQQQNHQHHHLQHPIQHHPQPPPVASIPALQAPTAPQFSEPAPTTGKERLLKAGVKFEEDDPDLPEERCLTYYVVSMTWNAHAPRSNRL